MRFPHIAGTALLGLALAACSGELTGPAGATAPAATEASARTINIYRSPSCGCCHEWAAILGRDGWQVATADLEDMAGFKQSWGVPEAAASCHTAFVDGYIVEGHVPLAAIERLLAERPAIDGIALPGMPAGSPGMGGDQEAPFEVLALVDGQVSGIFGTY